MSWEHDEVEDLFRKEAPDIRRFLIAMGASPADVDGYVNDGFLAVARKWSQMSGEGHRPVAYASKVALHAFYKSCKRGRREVPGGEYMDSMPCVTVDPLDRLIREQDHVAVRWALDRLPRREKEAIVLRHVNEFSVDKCAEIMGISAGAVKRYTSDGLRGLRAILEDMNGEGEGR